MKVEEYIEKQNENKRLFSEAKSKGQGRICHNMAVKMERLEKEFFLENFADHKDDFRLQMVKEESYDGEIINKLVVCDQDGRYLFKATQRELTAAMGEKLAESTIEEASRQTPELYIEQQVSGYLDLGLEKLVVSHISNRVSSLEEKHLAQKDVAQDSSPLMKPADTQSEYKTQLQAIQLASGLREGAANNQEEKADHISKPK